MTERPDPNAEAATAHYMGRSAAFYRVLAEDAVDGDDEALATWAHGILGRAIEGEVFGDREQGEGSAPDDVQEAGEPPE